MGWLFISIKLENQKSDEERKYLLINKMILFAKAQIVGGIVPNLITFGLFLVAIGYFALTGKMAEMFGWRNKK